MVSKDRKSWRRVYGTEKPYFIYNGRKYLIRDKSRIRKFKEGRVIKVLSSISKKFMRGL